MKKLFCLILVLSLLLGEVASALIKGTLANSFITGTAVTDPKLILELECQYKFGSSFLSYVCKKKDLISYFFYGLSALCSVGILFAIYVLFSTNINLFYLKIVSDFSSNTKKVEQADRDSENTMEGKQAGWKIFWNSLKWTAIFISIGLFFSYIFMV